MTIEAVLEAYKNKDFAKARELLAPILAAEPNNEQALAIAETAQQQQQALDLLLKVNPKNPHALKKQRQLNAANQLQLEPMTDSNTAAVYEMLWDCQYCGSKKLLGKTHRFCPTCGAAQDPKQRYFPSDEEKIAVKDHQYVGADKVCVACSFANAANVKFCTNCGAAMDEAKTVELAATEVKEENQVFADSETIEQQLQSQRQQQFAHEATDSQTDKKSRKLKIGAIIFAVITVLAILIFWTETKTVNVNAFSWQRKINIEDYASRHKDDWCNQMPGDAYSVSKTEKIRSYRHIPDGEECSTHRIDRGDGTYTEKEECHTKYRDEPVYDDYCHYRVNRWEYARHALSSGMDKSPYWPDYRLTCTDQRLGCERPGTQEAAYMLHLYDAPENETYTCKVAENFWQSVPLNSSWQLEVRQVLNDPRCSSLKPIN